MWSKARHDLGLSEDEFIALTPKLFDELLRRYRNQIESNELLFGQLTSWVVNTGFRSTRKPTKALDFMPSQWKRTEQKPRVVPRRKREDIASEADFVMKQFMSMR
jgi:hypothetical protein